jgi:hypothetical protein
MIARLPAPSVVFPEPVVAMKIEERTREASLRPEFRFPLPAAVAIPAPPVVFPEPVVTMKIEERTREGSFRPPGPPLATS